MLRFVHHPWVIVQDRASEDVNHHDDDDGDDLYRKDEGGNSWCSAVVSVSLMGWIFHPKEMVPQSSTLYSSFINIIYIFTSFRNKVMCEWLDDVCLCAWNVPLHQIYVLAR